MENNFWHRFVKVGIAGAFGLTLMAFIVSLPMTISRALFFWWLGYETLWSQFAAGFCGAVFLALCITWFCKGKVECS